MELPQRPPNELRHGTGRPKRQCVAEPRRMLPASTLGRGLEKMVETNHKHP